MKANTTGLGEYTDNDLITELENRGVAPKYHIADVTFADYGMQHTMRCGENKMACPFHIWLTDRYLENAGMSPFQPGKYELVMDSKSGEIGMVLKELRKGTL